MTPVDLARDRAICDAAPEHLAKMVDDVGRIDLVSENTGAFGYDPIAIGVGEEFADFAIAARERWPLYIDTVERQAVYIGKIEFAIEQNVRLAAEKIRMQERFAAVEKTAADAESAARRHAEMSEAAGAERETARASALRWALRTMRGEK